MTSGVILASFGKPQYMYMAAQLAGTLIAENPDIKIALLHDDSIRYLPVKYHKLFDKVIPLKKEHLYKHGRIDPGFVKINIPAYLPYDNNLYLDVDASCLKDVSPLFETEKDFATEVSGSGGFDDTINYMYWASNEDAWEYFQLPKEATFRTVQSSSMFFRKGKFVEKLHKELLKAYDYPMQKLAANWGGTMPDELIISGVCAKMEYDPAFKEPVVFFGYKYSKDSLSERTQKYYIHAIYGPKNLVLSIYLDEYNRMVIKKLSKVGLNMISNAQTLIRGKHAQVR